VRDAKLQFTRAVAASDGVVDFGGQRLSLVATLYAADGSAAFEPKVRAAPAPRRGRGGARTPPQAPRNRLRAEQRAAPPAAPLPRQEYALKAQAAPAGAEAGARAATFARARLDLARFAVPEANGSADDLLVPLAPAAPAGGAPPPPLQLRVSVRATWIKRCAPRGEGAEGDALSDVSGVSARARPAAARAASRAARFAPRDTTGAPAPSGAPCMPRAARRRRRRAARAGIAPARCACGHGV
jgi:hypothetical protein